MRKEGKAVVAGVTAQDNMHWASCPPVELRGHASRPARRSNAKINSCAKFVSYIIRTRSVQNLQDVFLNLKPLPALLLHCYAVPVPR